MKLYTIGDYHTKARRAFIHLISCPKNYNDEPDVYKICVMVISQKTGRVLNRYTLDEGYLDAILAFDNYTALVRYAKAHHEQWLPDGYIVYRGNLLNPVRTPPNDSQESTPCPVPVPAPAKSAVRGRGIFFESPLQPPKDDDDDNYVEIDCVFCGKQLGIANNFEAHLCDWCADIPIAQEYLSEYNCGYERVAQ